MTDPRDGIDAWLNAQVQPLPPPPGTFELIRKRARRRKMTRAAAAAAGAAAVIAVIATVPRLVLTQLHTGPGAAASSSDLGRDSAANGRRQHHQRPSATPQPTPDAAPTAVAPPAAPPDFAATSVTFVGHRDRLRARPGGHARALRAAVGVHLHIARGHQRLAAGPGTG